MWCYRRVTKREATHNQYFPEFNDLVSSDETTLSDLAARPDYVRSLFTRYLKLMSEPLSVQFQSLPLAA